MNTEQVKKIGSESETAIAIMSEWNSRKRISNEVNVDRLIIKLKNKGFKIVDDEAYATMKKLEAAGVGSIIHGRNGKDTRFKMNYSLKKIGSLGLGASDDELLPVDKSIKGTVSDTIAPKRGRGRPKGSKNKKTLQMSKRGKGRPKGSKNKRYTVKLTRSQMAQLNLL